MNAEIKKPKLSLYWTESWRSFFETIKGLIYLLTTKKTNEGQGRIVMVVPGLLTSDFWTLILRWFLQKKGYTVYGWEMGYNFGTLEKLPLLAQKIQQISQNNQKKVSIVGWSMGGLFCREVSHQIPQYIEQIITLGSPFANVHAPNNAKWVYELLNDESEIDHKTTSRLSLNTLMPSAAIYSKKDGIVPWEACMDTIVDDHHRNIEVVSSHFGMASNPNVLNAVFSALHTLA